MEIVAVILLLVIAILLYKIYSILSQINSNLVRIDNSILGEIREHMTNMTGSIGNYISGLRDDFKK